MKTDQSVYLPANKTINPWLTLPVILLAPLVTVIDVFIMNVSLPTIQTFFHASNAAVQLVIATYLVGYAVFLITGSRAGDHFGRKKVFLWGLFAFTVASVLCGYAATVTQLIAFRFVQGIAAGFAVPQTVTLIQLHFESDAQRSKAFGYYGITLGIASILGQFLGGYFVTSHLIKDSWRLIFLVNVPIGAVAIILGRFFIHESKLNQSARFDVPGVFLLTIALSALIYPIIQGREQGWPWYTVALLPVALLLLWWFILYQRKRIRTNQDPLVHLHLFTIRSFNIGILIVVFYFGLYSAFLLSSAIFLQAGHHIDPLRASLYFVVLGLAFMFSSHWSIKNGQRYGLRALQAGTVLLLVSFGLQFFLLGQEISIARVLLSFIPYGFGAGILVPSMLKVALQHVPQQYAGIGSGVYTTIQQFSSALGVSVIGGIFFYTTQRAGGDYNTGYRAAVVCMFTYAFVILVLLYLLKRSEAAGKKPA